ncbi:Serine carboxypeptidase-like 20 [Castilleja foliolosa]|uniref:Carboxypeptidase n=1 Tax=Castilleja foliolosa TaxID=1961234 RepID=A0ABD3BGA3_9LAMI
MRNIILYYLTLILAIQIALSFTPALSAPEAALVSTLPGFNGTLPSKHYSGYITLDEAHGKKLFYYFVESERNSAKDPIVLWLNGGPGCSSFDGFVYEHGPFNFEAGKTRGSLPTLHLNPYSWSKVSSVLYLDSPSGTGFSYSGNKSDYITGDLKTASDSHSFLLKVWFELYPEFISNPFYITGESYAGIYVPTLANEIVQGIDAGVKPTLNFKGYMVGNGVTDDEFDGNALVPFAHGMGLISDELFEAVDAGCKGNYFNSNSENCQKLLGKVYEAIKDLNFYDILEPCYHSTSRRNVLENTKLPLSFRRLGETERPLPVRARMFGRAWPFRAPVKEGYVPTWPELMDSHSNSVPCTDDEVATAWLNNKAVRKAIHAESEKVAGRWDLCTGRIRLYHDSGSMIKYHKNLTSKGYRALIYSGDHDMCVPFTGSEAWTRSVGYKIVDEWRPWMVKDQVAGYIQGYDKNFTFLTIKGAGHTVPEYKPVEALEFYTRFLEGRKI